MHAAVLSVSISNITLHSGDHKTKCEQKGINPGTHCHCTGIPTLKYCIHCTCRCPRRCSWVNKASRWYYQENNILNI